MIQMSCSLPHSDKRCLEQQRYFNPGAVPENFEYWGGARLLMGAGQFIVGLNMTKTGYYFSYE